MDVTPYEVTVNSVELVLVDTPGFDDSSMSDCQILQAIASWLEKTYEKGCRLNGLIYLHPINIKRMEGSAVRALHLFQRICGQDNYKNVLLATTFWNTIEHCKDEGIDREQRLLQTEGFWKSMKDGGAQTRRLSRNYKGIIPAILNMATQPKVTLDLQNQLKDGVPLEQTMAGLFVKDDSKELEEQHLAKSLRMKKDFDKLLEEHEKKHSAARAAHHRSTAEETETVIATTKKQTEDLEHQIELLSLNQKVKEAELAARLREEEEHARKLQKEQEAEQHRARRQAHENESRQRFRLSLTQSKKVSQQIAIFGAVCQAGISVVSVPEISRELPRSGLNTWCDYCLNPFGVGDRLGRHSHARRRRTPVFSMDPANHRSYNRMLYMHN